MVSWSGASLLDYRWLASSSEPRVGVTHHGVAPSFRRASLRSVSSNITRASSKQSSSMACSIVRRHPKPFGVGAMRPGGTSSSHKRRRNSSAIGSACLRTRSTACNSSMSDYLLDDKVGPVLFQLPPDFAADAGRLGGFLALLPEHRRYSFEFRHLSWYAPKILRILADRNISLCISGSSRCSGPMGAHCGLRLFARPWPKRPIRRSLLASNACRLAQVDPAVAAE
jgi:hypothetical protein